MKVIFTWMFITLTLSAADIDPTTILVLGHGGDEAFHKKMDAEAKKLKHVKWTIVKLKEPKDKKDYEESNLFDWVSPNYIYGIEALPGDPYFPEQWCHRIMQSERAWDITTGSDVVWAVVDTGIDYSHPDLVGNLWTGPSGEHGYTILSGNVTPNGRDDHFHGTHVAGIIGAVGNNNVGVAGVNWRIKLISMKFLNHYGSGSAADAIMCLDKLIELKRSGVNIRGANHSWGGPFNDIAVQDAFREVEAEGILNVCAAMNQNIDTDIWRVSPAGVDVDSIISVLASDETDHRAIFSNYGVWSTDLFAPGVKILSTMIGGGYEYFNGTSMATPQVSGAAAVMFALNPNLTPLQVRQILLEPSSYDRTSEPLNSTAGGRLNLFKTWSNPLIHNPPPLNHVPSATLLPNTNIVVVPAGEKRGISVSGTDPDGDALAYYTAWETSGYSTFIKQILGGQFSSGYVATNLLVLTGRNLALDQHINARFAVNDKRGLTTLRNASAWTYANTNLKQNLNAAITGWKVWKDSTNWPWFRLDVSPTYPNPVRFEVKIVGGNPAASLGAGCCYSANTDHKATVNNFPTGSYTLRAVALDTFGNFATSPGFVYSINSTSRPPTIRISYNTKRGPAPLRVIADMSATLPGDSVKPYYKSTINVDQFDLYNPVREIILGVPGVYDIGFLTYDSANSISDIIYDVFTVLPPELPDTPPTPILSAPQNLTAWHSGGFMQLQWDEVAIGEDRLVLEQSTKSHGPWSPWRSLVTLPANTRRYGFPTPGGHYQFRARACAGTTCGLFSNVATIRVR